MQLEARLPSSRTFHLRQSITKYSVLAVYKAIIKVRLVWSTRWTYRRKSGPFMVSVGVKINREVQFELGPLESDLVLAIYCLRPKLKL